MWTCFQRLGMSVQGPSLHVMISLILITYYLACRSSTYFFWNSNGSSLNLLWIFTSLMSHFLRTLSRHPWRFLPSESGALRIYLEAPGCNGNVNLPAVPSGATGWWPCLHKRDLSSLCVPVYWPHFPAPVIKQLSSCQSPRQMAEVVGLGSVPAADTQGLCAPWCPGGAVRIPEHFQMLLVSTRPCLR